jgi:hypothetical protein
LCLTALPWHFLVANVSDWVNRHQQIQYGNRLGGGAC